MNTSVIEANFDSLVGPTHHYSGMAFGNVKSMKNKGRSSNPKQAAFEGLKKMKILADLGIAQGVLPAQERPYLPRLRELGFTGSDRDIITRVAEKDARLLVAHCSASPMWTANSATLTPSCDVEDGRVHFTAANLVQQYHRSIEAPASARILEEVFKDPDRFCHHPPVPPHPWLGDEGAANHLRLCPRHEEPGYHLFVYGFDPFGNEQGRPKRYPARQSLAACGAISRSHGLAESRARFVQLKPEAIDAGAFHADVIATSNEHLVLIHEDAFVDQEETLNWLKQKIGDTFCVVEVSRRDLPLDAAVESYLFNSQVVTLPSGGMTMIVPRRCVEVREARQALSAIVEGDNPISSFQLVDLDQSMRNGGGPACLRLRVVLTEEEQRRVHPGLWLTNKLEQALVGWIDRHYRDRLSLEDLRDPEFHREVMTALDELSCILSMGSIYSFQHDLPMVNNYAEPTTAP